MAALGDDTRRFGAVVGRGRRDLRAGANDPRLHGAYTRVRALCGPPLYHLGLLVHGLYVLRQSRSNHRQVPFRHLCRNSTLRCGSLHRRLTGGNARGSQPQSMALAKRMTAGMTRSAKERSPKRIDGVHEYDGRGRDRNEFGRGGVGSVQRDRCAVRDHEAKRGRMSR